MLLLAINIPLVGLFARMLSVPAWVQVPFIVVVSTIGVAAYLLRRIGVPMAPLILGLVLGKILEQSLRRSLSGGEVAILWSSSIAIVLWGMAAAVFLVPLVLKRWKLGLPKPSGV